ncbi:diphthine methyltransferase homolog [Mangifera indica]|uniref:diphthine methyltransferase homolog n=1 Tax=Mangifera indica TaxID=29780 RepID=UPI001CFB6CF3|nr:diphthine methyltransferase homolog [Mangifera indica]
MSMLKRSGPPCAFCLEWDPSARSITVGLSYGSLSIICLEESKLEIRQEWKALGFELWATSFDIHQPYLVYTGSESPIDPNTVLTGGYDEHMRAWDVGSISKPVNGTLVCLVGGVWRIKHHPFVRDVVLTVVCTMDL